MNVTTTTLAPEHVKADPAPPWCRKSSRPAASRPGWSRITPCRSSRSNSPSRAARRRIPRARPARRQSARRPARRGRRPVRRRGLSTARSTNTRSNCRFSADRDMLTGQLQTLSRNSAQAFELLRLAVNEPRFDAEPFERVRGQIAAGLKREANDPDTMAAAGFRGGRLAGPSLWPARARRTRRASDADARRPRRPARQNVRARQSQDRRRRRHRRRDAFRPSRRRLRRRCRRRPISRPCRTSPFQGEGRRIIVDIDVPQSTIRFGRQGLARTRSRLYSPPSWSITCWAAASSPRACSARCARSAASPIRSIRSFVTYDHSRDASSAAPRPRTSAPPSRWR